MRIWEIISAEIKIDKEEDEDGDMMKVCRIRPSRVILAGEGRCLKGLSRKERERQRARARKREGALAHLLAAQRTPLFGGPRFIHPPSPSLCVLHPPLPSLPFSLSLSFVVPSSVFRFLVCCTDEVARWVTAITHVSAWIDGVHEIQHRWDPTIGKHGYCGCRLRGLTITWFSSAVNALTF